MISAVSGGGYTLAWLLDHVISGSGSVSEVLAPDSAAVRQVQEDPVIFETGLSNLIIRFITGIGSSLTTLAPTAALAAMGHIEPDFGQHGFGYVKNLEDVFSAPSDSWFSSPTSLRDIRRLMDEEALVVSFPIINASVLPQDRGNYCRKVQHPSALSLQYRLPFEITPLRVGNDELGYTDVYGRPSDRHYLQNFGLFEAAAISGAGPDEPGNRMCEWVSLGGGVGANIYGFIPTHKVVLTPQAGAINVTDGSDAAVLQSERLRLADGGIVDNLGLFSVAKRLCRSIIVFDAAHDPYLTFDSLFKAKELLEDDRVMHANFVIPEVMNRIAVESQERIAHGRSTKCQLGDECYDESLTHCPGSSSCLRADGMTDNAFKGCIGSFPWPAIEKALDQEVWYVKLGLDRSEIETYPEIVRRIWKRDIESMGHDGKLDCKGSGLEHRCGFPQEATTRQDLTPEEYEAYMALGRHIVENQLFPKLEEAANSGAACGGTS